MVGGRLMALRDIVQRFAGKLALNCDIVQDGIIRVGQKVDLLPSGEIPHAT
jgi:hypothetical protein